MEDGLTQRVKWLEKQCNFKLPSSLVHLARFLAGDGKKMLDELKLRATGPLAMLLAAEAPTQLDDPTGLNVPFLEARHARDLPELFTYLEGREDGLHWALLRDRPDEAPCGVASFCSQDTAPLRLHGGVFAGLLDFVADQLAATQELIEDEREQEAAHRGRVPVLEARDISLRAYADTHRLPLDEGRGRGLASDTGLGLILPAAHASAVPSSDGVRKLDRPADVHAACQRALAECDHGRPYDALVLGRSLFYWKGASERETAGVLLDRGYAAVGLHPLARVLAAHLEQLEDLEGVQDAGPDDEEEESIDD